ncbi:hypothetical protein GF323_00770 [Candidatus Woesearchaeota archaeon]|nr:hypothetical protein [Candidatus Woesearchaeota archaeon]
MREISNSTLALMVVAAIIVSVFGTFMSLSKLNQLSGPTGFATSETGKANLTVSSTASISLVDDLIEMGTMDHNQTNWSYHLGIEDYWHVENNGGVNISIEIYSTAQGPGGTYEANQGIGPFITASTANDDSGCLKSDFNHSCFMVRCNSSLSGTCDATYYPLSNNTAGNNNKHLVDLDYQDSVDDAYFDINVTVPYGEPSGNKEIDVTFFAASSE